MNDHHMPLPKSAEVIEATRAFVPGGVNSPVRAFGAVGGTPPVIARASGSRVYDVDGNEYIDYVGSWGPMILGHAHPAVVEAVREAASRGLSYGAPTEGELELARLVIDRHPTIEMMRLVSSGTEATMSALRLARGYTNRPKFVKFTGHYHGHGDAFLVAAGSGAVTFGVPNSPGVPANTVRDTLLAPFNDLGAVEALFAEQGDEIACVFLEAVAGNMGLVPPDPGFLEGLRKLCTDHGALLVFDEVMTGFRLAFGGAQERLDIQPDLTTLGKVVGGGMPVGAYGGRREILEKIAPAGPVYQAGTLSGNPLGVAAGKATLERLDDAVYAKLESLGDRLEEGMRRTIAEGGWPLTYQRVGSMACLYFRAEPVRNFEDALGSDTERFGKYFHGMLRRGVYLAPSQFEAGFLSTAHTEADIDRTLEAGREALQEAFA